MIAQLKAMIGLDSRQYVAGARQVQGTTQRMQRSFQQIGRVIGVSFSVAGIVAMTRAIARWSSEISLAARNAGILTSEMVAFNRVGLQAGLQVNDMQRLLTRMQTELFNAARGSEQAAEKFEKMGLDVGKLTQMDPAQMMQEVARAATQTGIPLENLANLFGERLGPNARVALESIARDGLPEVDKAIGTTMDRVEELSSAWARFVDNSKEKTLQFVTTVANNFRDLQAGMRGLGEGTGFAAGINRSQEQREQKISDMIKQREDEQKRNAQELSRIYEDSLKKQMDTLREAMEQRIQQTERLRGTAPTLSSMEQMGASFGGDRTQGLRAADRQLQVAQEQLRVQQEFAGRMQDIQERLDNIVREM